MIRRQLPAYSPLGVGHLLDSALRGVWDVEEGPRRLEEHLADRFSADRAVALASGTQALQLALALVADGDPGALSALPGYTCYDVATAAVGSRTRAWLYDLDPVTLTPDPTTVRAALDAGARSLVACTLYGYPVDWTTLADEAHAAGAYLIEDAAQGIGSSWAGRPGGSWGDLTVLSFGRGKGWTGGGGGALLVRQPELVARLARLLPPMRRDRGTRTLVASCGQWLLGRPALFGLPSRVPGLRIGETVYKEPARIGAIASITARAVLASANDAVAEIDARRRNAARWEDALDAASAARLCSPLDPSKCGYLRLPIVPDNAGLAALSASGARARGVARGYPRPLGELDELRELRVREAPPTPGAHELAHRLRTLPTHSRVADRDFDAVCALLEG